MERPGPDAPPVVVSTYNYLDKKLKGIDSVLNDPKYSAFEEILEDIKELIKVAGCLNTMVETMGSVLEEVDEAYQGVGDFEGTGRNMVDVAPTVSAMIARLYEERK